MYSIYRITNRINGKIYIGYSKRPAARWYDHKKYATLNKKGVVYDAMRKYGIENFTFEIIYQSLNMVHTRDIMENYFITEYNCRTPNGYNNAPGGQGGAIRVGFKHSEFTKIKISKAHKGKKISSEIRSKISKKLRGVNNPMYGKHHSDITKKIMSEKAKQREYDPKCREYISGPSNPTSKNYIICTPENKTIQITNLKYFCLQNKLNHGEMWRTLKGKARQHKGYRVVSVL